MADLKINYANTRSAGNTVKQKSSEFSDLLRAIHEQNEELKSHWQGADADSYTKKISEQEQVMKNLKSAMDEMGEYLVKVANAYEEAMESNKIN